MRAIRLLLTGLFAFTALAVVVEPATAAGSKNLQIYYAHPIKNENFSAYGQLTTPVARPVYLQYRNKNSGAWKTTKKFTSNVVGSFEVVTHSSKSRYYRFYAPKAKVEGTVYAKIVGNSKHVTLAKQEVEYAGLTPNVVCKDTGEVTVFVDFAPARQYRPVHFETPNVTYIRLEDSHGRSSLTFTPVQGVGTYHVTVMAQASNGAAALVTKELSFSIVNCLDV